MGLSSVDEWGGYGRDDGKALVQVHSSANLSQGQRGRERTREEHPDVLDWITMAEMKRANQI